MLIKGLLIASAAGLMSTVAFAQDADRQSAPPETSATSPNTVNPPMPAAPGTPAPADRSAVPPHSSATASPPAASTGTRSDVAAVSPDAAIAAGGTVETVASAPIPDTAENRAKYGAPMSATGKRTPARGN